MMDDLILRATAIEAAVDGADDWDGGYNPERERYIREHMAKVSAVDAVPIDFLMRYAQLPTEFAIAAWQRAKKEAKTREAKSLDKPMSFDDAFQRVNEAVKWE